MAISKAFTGFDRKVVEVPAYSLATLDYMGVHPNYFKVQNQGAEIVYCSTNNFPTPSAYDLMVGGGKAKLWAEPYEKTRFHIYNGGGTPCRVVVMSFQAEFDPVALAMSDLEIDLSDVSIESDNVISGFATSLPAGSNTIGGVKVVEMAALPTGGNHIGEVAVSNMKDYAQVLADILAALGNGGTGGGSSSWSAEDVAMVLERLTNLNSTNGSTIVSDSFTATPDGILLNPISPIKKLITVSNDGESDLTITITNENGYECDIVLKAGEVLNDVYGSVTKGIFMGDNVPCRYIASL